MNILGRIYIFYIGSCFASFLYCSAIQYPQELSLRKNRSKCDSCQVVLSFKDLFPIFSFLAAKGKCRYCQVPLSSAYFWSEVSGGILSFCIFTHHSESLSRLLLYSCLYILLFLLASIDQLYFLLPDFLQIGLLALFLLFQVFLPVLSWKAALNGLLVWLVLAIIAASVVPQGMGGGDLKLIALFGFHLGVNQTSLLLLLASFLGLSFISLRTFFCHQSYREPIPFGPFLIFSFFVIKESSLFFS